MDSLEIAVMEMLLTLQPSWIQISPGSLLNSSVWDASYPSGLRVTVERYPSQLRMTASGPAPTSETAPTVSTGYYEEQLTFEAALASRATVRQPYPGRPQVVPVVDPKRL